MWLWGRFKGKFVVRIYGGLVVTCGAFVERAMSSKLYISGLGLG